MNKNVKLLASTLCGVLLSSGLALTTLQASPAKSNVKTNISTSTKLATVSLSPFIVYSGGLYWNAISGATDYKVDVINITPGGLYNHVVTRIDNGDYTNVNLSSNFSDPSQSHNAVVDGDTYQATVTALDSSRNTIATAQVTFIYSSHNFVQQ